LSFGFGIVFWGGGGVGAPRWLPPNRGGPWGGIPGPTGVGKKKKHPPFGLPNPVPQGLYGPKREGTRWFVSGARHPPGWGLGTNWDCGPRGGGPQRGRGNFCPFEPKTTKKLSLAAPSNGGGPLTPERGWGKKKTKKGGGGGGGGGNRFFERGLPLVGARPSGGQGPGGGGAGAFAGGVPPKG